MQSFIVSFFWGEACGCAHTHGDPWLIAACLNLRPSSCLSEVAYSSVSAILYVRGDYCMANKRSRGAKKAWSASRDKKVAKAREKEKERKAERMN